VLDGTRRPGGAFVLLLVTAMRAVPAVFVSVGLLSLAALAS
jgi:hypothetical protein